MYFHRQTDREETQTKDNDKKNQKQLTTHVLL